MSKCGSVTFWNGKQMPIFGLGTWKSTPEEIEAAVDAALEAGYRHIDTAAGYNNEAAIGNALKKWFDSGKIKREELFIVTKLPLTALQAEKVEPLLNRSLAALQLSYVDLYLIHFPAGVLETWQLDPTTDHISLWKAMEAQVDVGKAHSIGLSNFTSRQIKRIVRAARIKPANLQVELHAYFQQRELVAFCKALDITVCAYSPLGSPGYSKFVEKATGSSDGVNDLDILSNPVVKEIAHKHKKTTAQVLLRHIIQRGIVVIPKSVKPDRIRENFQVFDFTLDEDDVWKLDSLDKRNRGRLVDFGVMKMLKNHPEFPFNDAY